MRDINERKYSVVLWNDCIQNLDGADYANHLASLVPWDHQCCLERAVQQSPTMKGAKETDLVQNLLGRWEFSSLSKNLDPPNQHL
jgi:hypothetical protein